MDFSVESEGMKKILSTNASQPREKGDEEGVSSEAEKAFAGINAGFGSGFKTAESNIDDLG